MSKEYRGKKIVVWPAYIDASLSRSKGRRVPQSIAVPNPSIDEIVSASKELGLDPLVEESPYPRAWWKYKERVVVTKKTSKTRLLKMIALKIKELRKRK